MLNFFPFPRRDSRFVLLTRLLTLLLVVFFLLRLRLTFTSWAQIPHDPATLLLIFGGGLMQDVAFSLCALLPPALLLLVLPQHLLGSRPVAALSRILLFFSMTAVAFVVAAEVLFWQEFSTRFNFIAVDYLIYSREVSQNIYESYPMGIVALYLLVASLLLFSLLSAALKQSLSATEPFGRRGARFGGLVLLTLIAGLVPSAGQLRPSSNNYVNELAANGPYQFVAAFRNNTLNYRTFYRLAEDDSLSQQLRRDLQIPGAAKNLYDIGRPITSGQPPRKLNIILITVESLSASYLDGLPDSSAKYKGLTPFLDKLATQSLFFSDLYATGTRTTRGLEAITLSLPPTPGRSLVKRPDNGPFYSLGGVLQQHGYDTAFVYGGRGYFDNMNAFFSGNGYRIIDEGDFADSDISFKNAWGVCDEDLYNKTIQQADRSAASGRPFFFHLMTTSNHRPYTYPDGQIDIPSGTGREGAVRYTDYALEQFFTRARQHDWFDNTLFVVIADHCAGSAGKVGLPIDKYHIPLLIYAPAHIAPTRFTQVASQIDLAPTLLGLLHLNYTSHFFGEDVLAAGYQPRAFIGNYQKLGLYRDDRLVILEPQQRIFCIDNPWHSETLLPGDDQQPEVQLAQAYYQGADYLIQHKLHHQGGASTGTLTARPQPATPPSPKTSLNSLLGQLLFKALCCTKGQSS
ncbi:MAG: LTA synthase family protein [Desulfuromonadaceae bacterium]|nr:LTA synthase family protein [Desulfuromonadaceae bacterium]